MNTRWLVLAAALFVGALAETVVKKSEAFSFPEGLGNARNAAFGTTAPSFVCKPHWANNALELSWSLASAGDKGTIALYNVRGSQIKIFPVTAPRGTVRWDNSMGAAPARGIYLARLSCGEYKRNLKIVLYR